MDHQPILTRVGIALVILGVLDIAVMISCIVSKISGSSSFNIFAVMAGVLLIRGSIRTAEFVRSAAAFFMAAIGCLLFSMLVGLALQGVDASNVSGFLPIAAALLAFLYWVYSQLGHERVLQARCDAGLSDKPLRAAFVTGLLFLSVAGLTLLTLVGRDGRYKDLKRAFTGATDLGTARIVSSEIVLTSNRHRGPFSYTVVVQVGLTDSSVIVDLKFPIDIVLRSVEIPIQSTSGCGKTCGGWWHADLLIEWTGTEFSVPETQDVLDWCGGIEGLGSRKAAV